MLKKIKGIKFKLFSSIGLSFVLLIVIIFVAYRLTSYYATTQFLKVYEQKVLSELDIYHDGVSKLIMEKITDKIEIIEASSRSMYLAKALGNNIGEAKKILEDIVGWNNSFNYLIALDNKGNLLTIAGLSPEGEAKVVHGNYANRDYFNQVMNIKKTYISKVFFATGDYWVITVSAPIFDASGKIKYVLVGSDKLQDLSQNFNSKMRFTDLYSVLVNQDGDSILQNSEIVEKKINLAKNDKFIKDFITNGREKFGIETNYKGETVYARGSQISWTTNNKFYLISYMPYSLVETELKKVDIGVRDLYLIVFALAIVVFVASWLMSIVIISDLVRRIT